MSHSVLVLGESGCGKSTAIRTLPPKETMIINVIGKPLPFRGANKKYSDDYAAIMRVISLVNNKRADIKYLVIDDYGYTITNSFMRKANQKGYDKFVEMAAESFNILEKIGSLRDDLFCFVMMHTEIDQQGRYKPKTVGKMIDQYVNIEGKFTYVFHALVNDSEYVFLTNNDSRHMAKTPMGLFDDLFIPNDLNLICETIINYEDEE